MSVAIAELESLSPYEQGKHYQVPKLDGENDKEYEERTWRERAHIDPEGYLFIPPMALKNCLSEAAKYLSMKIPSKAKNTYTKHFEAGIMVVDGVRLPIKKGEIQGLWLFVPSDGKRGGSKRVSKCFPVVQSWKGTATFHILDETITEEVFSKHLEAAGQFIGIGAFRPRNNGYFGRFKVNSIRWQSERKSK